MINGKIRVQNSLALLIALLALAWPANVSAKPTGDCHIRVLITLRSEKSHFKTFHRDAGSREECAELAEAHRSEFLPDNVATKSVTYLFGDEEDSDE